MSSGPGVDRSSVGGRRVGATMVVCLGLLFVALAAWWVPWGVGGDAAAPAARDVFDGDHLARVEEFAGRARSLSWASLLVGLAVLLTIGLTSLGRRLVRRLPGPWWWVTAQTVLLVVLVARLVTLPFAVAQHAHFAEAGLSTQGWTDWVVDVAKGELVEAVVLTVVAWVLVGTARRWRRAWPAVAGMLLAGLTFAGSFAYPLLVEPVFNDFRPLRDGQLRHEVLAVAEREGVAVDQVLVADASRRTTTLNAYVSGLWGSRRVVLYDTLVADLPPDQVVAVVAHEIAHARHDDVLVGTALGAVGVAWSVGLWALVPGRRRPGDPAVVPLLLALVALGSVLAAPVQSTISRQVEIRADVEALRATGEPDAYARMQVRLATRALADPTPPAWAHVWFGSHPTVLERLALARVAQED